MGLLHLSNHVVQNCQTGEQMSQCIICSPVWQNFVPRDRPSCKKPIALAERGVHGNPERSHHQRHCHADTISERLTHRILTKIGGLGGGKPCNKVCKMATLKASKQAKTRQPQRTPSHAKQAQGVTAYRYCLNNFNLA